MQSKFFSVAIIGQSFGIFLTVSLSSLSSCFFITTLGAEKTLSRTCSFSTIKFILENQHFTLSPEGPMYASLHF